MKLRLTTGDSSEVRELIREIRETNQRDPEGANALRNEFYEAVLKFMAKEPFAVASEYVELAEQAAMASKIKIRW